MKESENIFSLWCSGRVCCEGMLITLKLLKRQDLISTISRMFKPQTDQIVRKWVSSGGNGIILNEMGLFWKKWGYFGRYGFLPEETGKKSNISNMLKIINQCCTFFTRSEAIYLHNSTRPTWQYDTTILATDHFHYLTVYLHML